MRFSARAAVLSAAVLGALVAIASIVWSHPKILLWVLLVLIGILAYAALYLIISARLKPEAELAPPPETDEDGKVVPLTEPREAGKKSDSR